MIAVLTGSANRTTHIEDGEEVYPCSCGETHRGKYGFETRAHHECPHDQGLVFLDGPEIRDMIDRHNKVTRGTVAICVPCGRTFKIEDVGA